MTVLPTPPTPFIPPHSTCSWFYKDSLEALSLPLNSTYPSPSLLPSSFLRSSVCLDDFTEADQSNLEAVIDAMDMIAMAVGVADDEWQEEECKAFLKRAFRSMTTPYCSPSSCAPLGFCDSDCHAGRELCGRLMTYDGVLEYVLPGGPFNLVLVGMVGADVLPCTVEFFQLASGNGDDSKICDSSSTTFSNMAFGSTPYVDCLPLSIENPNTVLRDPSSSGSCALSIWDEHAAGVAAVEAHNEALLVGANNSTQARDEELRREFPWWREVAVPGLPLLMFALLWVGDWFSLKKEEGKDLAAVTPVSASGDSAPSFLKLTRAQVLAGAERSTSSLVSKKLRFRDVFGATGNFVAVAQVAVGGLSASLGFVAENSEIDIPTVQVLALHCITVVAIFHTFDSVVYWRQLVTNLLDQKLSKEDPLEKLDKVPWLKQLVQGWRENFAVEHAGKYAIVFVVVQELIEFVTQTMNASHLARYVDWKTLGLYVNIISANGILFGVCLITPERFVDVSGMVAVDVLIGE